MSDDKTVSVQVNTDRKAIWMKTRAKTWDTEHRTWVQRGGYVGFRVPDDKIFPVFRSRACFPYQHVALSRNPGTTVLPVQRVLDAGRGSVAESWADNWYDTDDVYVRYDNGYYLYNQRYPGVGLSLEFSK
jgi:hypothetical protein